MLCSGGEIADADFIYLVAFAGVGFGPVDIRIGGTIDYGVGFFDFNNKFNSVRICDIKFGSRKRNYLVFFGGTNSRYRVSDEPVCTGDDDLQI